MLMAFIMFLLVALIGAVLLVAVYDAVKAPGDDDRAHMPQVEWKVDTQHPNTYTAEYR